MELPNGFSQKMKRLLGDEWSDFLECYDQPKTFGLRVNTLKISVDDFLSCIPFSLSPILWASDGFYYDEQVEPGKHPYHAAGLYYIQDPSAMAPAVLLNVKPGDRVLDLCAAPGGKSCQIGAALKGQGLLVANEIHPARVVALGENIERLGVKNAVITQEHPKKLAKVFQGFFDKILVDAPCSGEGMFRKNPDACSEWSEDAVNYCSQRQQDILEEAEIMLRPGGRLVYSTCTFSPEENEGTIDAFLKKHDDFEIITGNINGLSANGKPEWINADPNLKNAYRLWPHKLNGEGHFMVLMGKKPNNIYDIDSRFSGETKGIASKAERDKRLQLYYNFVDQYLNIGPEEDLMVQGDHIYRMSIDPDYLKGIRVLRPGFYLGCLKKNRFEPSHALALSLKKDQVKKYINLSSNGKDIYAYLKGESILNVDTNGWTLVTVDSYSIGWGKASDGQLKNHYPKGLRYSFS